MVELEITGHVCKSKFTKYHCGSPLPAYYYIGGMILEVRGAVGPLISELCNMGGGGGWLGLREYIYLISIISKNKKRGFRRMDAG